MKTLLKYFLLTLFLFPNYVNPNAQPSITWEKLYDGPDHHFDGGFDVCLADSGNLFFVGYTQLNNGINRIWVLKINSLGDTIWTRIVGTDAGIAMACASSFDGGCILTGDGYRTWVAKVDRDGNVNWYKKYEGSTVQIFSIINTVDGGYAACGRRNYDSAVVFKIDSLGNLEWMKIFGAGFYKRFQDIKEINDGFVLIGHVRYSIQDNRKPILLKLDKIGNTIMEKEYLFVERNSFKSIVSEKDNYLIGGTYTDSSSNKNQVYILRADIMGNILYYKKILNEYSEALNDIKKIRENKFVIASYTENGIYLFGRAIIIDSLGFKLFEKDFPAISFIEFRNIQTISNGDIVFSGVGELCNADCEDVYAVRTDSILNYKPILINTVNFQIPNGFKIYPAFPNPFNPETNIKFDVPKNENIEIIVSDVNGKKIFKLLDKYLTAGQYEIKWNASFLPTGVYFISIVIKNKLIQTQKTVLIK